MAKKKLRFAKKSRLDGIKADGSENVSSKPTELRRAIKNPITLRQKMSNLWNEFKIRDAESGPETMADAQDFDVDNDGYVASPYEVEHELADQFAYEDSQEPAGASAEPKSKGNPKSNDSEAEEAENGQDSGKSSV